MKHVNQTVEKPTNCLGMNILVDLDIRDNEKKVKTGAQGKVFENLYLLLSIYKIVLP